MLQPTLLTSAADESVTNGHAVPDQDMQRTNDTNTMVNRLTLDEIVYYANSTDGMDAMVNGDVTDITLPNGTTLREPA